MVLDTLLDPANSTFKYSDLVPGGKCLPGRFIILHLNTGCCLVTVLGRIEPVQPASFSTIIIIIIVMRLLSAIVLMAKRLTKVLNSFECMNCSRFLQSSHLRDEGTEPILFALGTIQRPHSHAEWGVSLRKIRPH